MWIIQISVPGRHEFFANNQARLRNTFYTIHRETLAFGNVPAEGKRRISGDRLTGDQKFLFSYSPFVYVLLNPYTSYSLFQKGTIRRKTNNQYGSVRPPTVCALHASTKFSRNEGFNLMLPTCFVEQLSRSKSPILFKQTVWPARTHRRLTT